MDTLSAIITNSSKLFMRYGIKSISMDDIARETGISKKTLYQFVDDKADLVKRTLKTFLNRDVEEFTCIINGDENPVKVLLIISKKVTENMQNLNPSMMFDLRKYYPKSWKLFQKHEHEVIYTSICTNLNCGKDRGFYREEIEVKLIAGLYIHMIDAILESEEFGFSNFSFKQKYQQLIKYHLYAITTKKGREALAKIEKEGV